MSTHVNNELYAEIEIPVPWGHIAGRWYGDQLRQPILALHGWLDNCGTYATLAPLLVEHTSLLCIDLPGHGLSSHLPVGLLYSNQEFVRAILRVMQAYNWKKVTLMGHSMGGAATFLFAALFPHRVEKVICIDIVKTRPFELELFCKWWKYSVEKSIVANERAILQSPMNEPPSYTFEECKQLLYEGSRYSVDLDHTEYILERNVTKSQKYPNKYYFSRDNRLKFLVETNPDDELADIMILRICKDSIPYLVIKGGASTNISQRSDRAISTFKKHNPLFEMYEIPNGKHHLHLNTPEPVAELIIAFLKKHDKSPTVDGRENNNKAKL